jgi:hypothetical protein
MNVQRQDQDIKEKKENTKVCYVSSLKSRVSQKKNIVDNIVIIVKYKLKYL